MNNEAEKTKQAILREQALADRDAQHAYEQQIYDRNRADAVADMATKREEALALEEQKRQNAIADTIAKGLRTEEAQRYLNNPQAYDVNTRGWYNPARWVGAKNVLVEKPQQVSTPQAQAEQNLQELDGIFFKYSGRGVK